MAEPGQDKEIPQYIAFTIFYNLSHSSYLSVKGERRAPGESAEAFFDGRYM